MTQSVSASVSQPASTTDEIRQIQMVMILLLMSSPDGPLSDIFTRAIAASSTQVNAKMVACTDVSFNGLKSWLESLLAKGDLTPEEQALVDWQNNPANMIAAIQELRTIQEKTNLKIGIQKKS
jgi:hypothetical protein